MVAAAAAISGHSRFSSLALVFLVSLALSLQGDVLPFFDVRALSAMPLRAQMPFVLVQCILALFVCSTRGAGGGWGAVGSATRRGSSAIKANVSRQ